MVTYRDTKGSELEWDEVDSNFRELAGADPVSPIGGMWRSDGAGEGEFIRIEGWGHYKDDRLSAGDPSLTLDDGVRTLALNNGVERIREKLPSDAIAPLWDVVANKVSPVADYDMYNLRMWWEAEDYSGGSPSLLVEFDLGGVDGVIWAQTIPLTGGGDTEHINIAFPSYAGPDMVANGGKFYFTYSGSSTCKIHSHNILVIRDSKNYV